MRSNPYFWIKVCLLTLIVGSGCATIASISLDQKFGEANTANRNTANINQSTFHEKYPDFYNDEVKPVVESRCVVCHACYDAPCQLKMTSKEGIERGANKQVVYEGTRLLEATPNRLFVDAFDTQEWRERDFFPVLNEREQSPIANTQASVLARMLMLKKQHPLPQDTLLDERFDVSISRDNQCPSIEEFDQYESEQPHAGMPYGLPGLNQSEDEALMLWLEQGANIPAASDLSVAEVNAVDSLELFLNGDSLNMQLSARYIYEHLFSTHLYFSEITNEQSQAQFFIMLRSSTPPGEPIQLIPGRRPYDEPGVDRVYYRLQAVRSTIVNKTHQAYAINQDLMDKWDRWFVKTSYQVKKLPGYSPEVAANPLIAFAQLPESSRYRFMLERAENTIMGYIKGPVCRGQVALNVINDRFWVFFSDPELVDSPKLKAFYASQTQNLSMPAQEESTVLASEWIKYAKRQGNYQQARHQFFNENFKNGEHIQVDAIWDGDGNNTNASLTVFRHFDNATVVKGLVGKPPKTAWVIDYVLLERIHYLLVAGFDVYGNYGHQLLTRLYMDFLRLEGESNFLAFLPPKERQRVQESWYKNAGTELSEYFQGNISPYKHASGIQFTTSFPQQELYSKFQGHLDEVQPLRYALATSELEETSIGLLQELNQISGKSAAIFPELTMIMVERGNKQAPEILTLIRNSAHFNVSSLFNEDDNRDTENDNVTLVHGILGSYPDAFWRVKEEELSSLVKRATSVRSESDYTRLLDEFGVRRTAPEFWLFSDQLHAAYSTHSPIDGGWLDYNRLENR
jgi:hypothetical protein